MSRDWQVDWLIAWLVLSMKINSTLWIDWLIEWFRAFCLIPNDWLMYSTGARGDAGLALVHNEYLNSVLRTSERFSFRPQDHLCVFNTVLRKTRSVRNCAHWKIHLEMQKKKYKKITPDVAEIHNEISYSRWVEINRALQARRHARDHHTNVSLESFRATVH